MKRIPFIWLKYSLLFLIVTVVACNKIDWDDVWHKHDPDCQVKKVTYELEAGPGVATGVFKYNHRGQPTSVVFDYVSTARPNLVFKYDHLGRLTDYIMPYDNDNYELWFKYKYDHTGRVVSDTQQVFGEYIDSVPLPSTYLQLPGFYEYDHWGRISKITRHYPMSTVISQEFEYNGDGNLSAIKEFTNGSPTSTRTFTTYDDKVSIFRTNKIWMFVSANYSKNNMIAADSYNGKGLPTQFSDPNFNVYRFLHETYLGKSTIEYRCK
jgi:hypothetical protein